MECSRTRSGLDKASDRILHGLKLPRAKRRKCPAFFPSFFFSFGVEAVEGQRRGRGTLSRRKLRREWWLWQITPCRTIHRLPDGKEGERREEGKKRGMERGSIPEWISPGPTLLLPNTDTRVFIKSSTNPRKQRVWRISVDMGDVLKESNLFSNHASFFTHAAFPFVHRWRYFFLYASTSNLFLFSSFRLKRSLSLSI